MESYKIKLTRSQREELVLIHQNTYERKAADRIKSILLLDEGYTKEEVAHILMLDRNTIRNFAKRYLDHGPEALMEDGYKGSEGYLDEAQLQELAEELNTNLYNAAKEIRLYILRAFGVRYSNDAAVKLLHRLGFVYKKTKGAPAKADLEKQKEFIEEYEKLTECLEKDEKVYFMDAMHLVHQSRPDYAWIKRGEERAIKTVSGRKRINMNGLYSPCDQETIIRRQDRVTGMSTLNLLKEIVRKHPDITRAIVFCDQGPAYRSKELRENLPAQIELRYLPSYSPNLNLIERLWKLLRKNVTNNKYFETFAIFKKEVSSFLKSLRGRKEELASLLFERFQIIDTS